MNRKVRWIVGLSMVVAGTFGGAEIARGETETAESENVRAEVSYVKNEDDWCMSDMTLKLIRSGETVLNRPLNVEEGLDCRLVDVKVRDLNGDREPEVIVDLYSGGAHCCFSSSIYSYQGDRDGYDSINWFWGNLEYDLRDIEGDGIVEFKTSDNRFAYAFSSYAASRFPPQFWRFQNGEMVNVTENYPNLVYGYAYQIWQEFQANGGQYKEADRAILAAYLASKYLLGQGADGWQRVRQVYQWGDRADFFSNLQDFLQETGYATSEQ